MCPNKGTEKKPGSHSSRPRSQGASPPTEEPAEAAGGVKKKGSERLKMRLFHLSEQVSSRMQLFTCDYVN